MRAVEEPVFLHQLQISLTKAGDTLVPLALRLECWFCHCPKETGWGTFCLPRKTSSVFTATTFAHGNTCSVPFLCSQISFPYPFSSHISSAGNAKKHISKWNSPSPDSPGEYLVRTSSRFSSVRNAVYVEAVLWQYTKTWKSHASSSWLIPSVAALLPIPLGSSTLMVTSQKSGPLSITVVKQKLSGKLPEGSGSCF